MFIPAGYVGQGLHHHQHMITIIIIAHGQNMTRGITIHHDPDRS